MHRSRRVLGLATALVGFFAAVPAANAVSAGVVVAEVYGGGGNSGATLTNDFVELGNAGAAAADVTGWSVQYLPAAPSADERLAGHAADRDGRRRRPVPDPRGSRCRGHGAPAHPGCHGDHRHGRDGRDRRRGQHHDTPGLQDRRRLRRGHAHHRPGRVWHCRRPRDGACTGNQQHHVRRPFDAHRYRQQRRGLHGRDAEPAERRECPTAAPAAGSGSTTSRATGISPRWRAQRSGRRAWSPRSVPSAPPGASGCRIRSLTPWRPRARASSSSPGPRRRPCSPAMP